MSKWTLRDGKLMEGNIEWMRDDGDRRSWMGEYGGVCEGEVVVGGLGMGLVVEALERNVRVTGITVVEIEKRVIDLVWRNLRTWKSTIVRGDVFHVLAERRSSPNWVVLDLWDDGAAVRRGKILEEMAPRMRKLRERFPETKWICHGLPELSDFAPAERL